MNFIEGLKHLPWYGYIIPIFLIISVGYKYFTKIKSVVVGGGIADIFDVEFRKSPDSNLTKNQLFSLALDAIVTECWKVKTNTLAFNKVGDFDEYMQNWGIDTREGYLGMKDYFLEDGRRGYFDFIYSMIKNEPQEKWNEIMTKKYGQNDRAERYLKLLSPGKDNSMELLKHKGFIDFDSDVEKGILGYDVSMAIGQARRAYSADLISEKEAWEIINTATKMAQETFSSWKEYAKSHIIGFALDMGARNRGSYREMYYHLYKQVLENPNSPWNTIEWISK